ncbi:MAG: NAD-dependent succinate-semialdehyde dehydrogenase [Candidatus Omnitrophica bacterium]|nr:NAD-dependent succinate-semialdehyde dehydrogenase [Candidatus Omnitrophota bacterium]
MPLEVINPATGEAIAAYEEMQPAEIEAALQRSQQAFVEWSKTPFAHRKELMHHAAQILEERADEYAQLMTQEMGKPIRDGRAEAKKCAWVCSYYANNAERFLQPEIIDTDAAKSFIAFQPIGIILAVMPWNFPFWQVFRFAAPALMAGNAGVLKHASNVPGCAMAIEEIFQRAGFPDSLFKTLLIGSPKVGAVIENPLVKAVTLTGSTPAGRAAAKKAGEMLKKTVLELGGSDPYVILEDADLDKAASLCAASRLINSGQSCIAAKRFILVESIADAFLGKFVECMRAAKIGDPMQEDTQVGPMARFDLRDELHDQVQRSVEKGARCILGGVIPEGKGAFYPATVLVDVKPGMPAYDEEIFGPVASVMIAKDERDAVRIANDSVFGLGAAVFTENVSRGERIAARDLEAGCCFVNSFVKSDPRLPFGGVKESGYGRELSHFGVKEFVNIKTVYIA